MSTHVSVRPVVARFPIAWGEGAVGTVTYRYGRDEVTLTTRAATLEAAEAEQTDAIARHFAGRPVTKTWESVVHAIDGVGTVAELTTTWAVEAKAEERAMATCERCATKAVSVVARADGAVLCDACAAKRRFRHYCAKHDRVWYTEEKERGRCHECPSPLAEATARHRLALARREEARAALAETALRACERCETRAVRVTPRPDGAVLCDGCDAARGAVAYRADWCDGDWRCARHDHPVGTDGRLRCLRCLRREPAPGGGKTYDYGVWGFGMLVANYPDDRGMGQPMDLPYTIASVRYSCQIHPDRGGRLPGIDVYRCDVLLETTARTLEDAEQGQRAWLVENGWDGARACSIGTKEDRRVVREGDFVTLTRRFYRPGVDERATYLPAGLGPAASPPDGRTVAARAEAWRLHLRAAKEHGEDLRALLKGRLVSVEAAHAAVLKGVATLRAALERAVTDGEAMDVIEDAIRHGIEVVDATIAERREDKAMRLEPGEVVRVPDPCEVRIVTDPPRPTPRTSPPPLPTHVCADCGGRIARGPSGLACCAACAARLGADYRGSRAVALASRRDEPVADAPDEGDYWATRPGRRWLTALLTVAGVASGWFGRETMEAARSLVEHARTWWPW